MSFSTLTTPRLMLRHFHPADLDPFLAYRSDPAVSRFQSWSTFTRAEARDFIEDMQRAQPGVPGTWFQFAVTRRSDGQLLGDTALFTSVNGRQGEIGYTVARAYQGHGYAREAVAAMIGYAFATAGLHRITATTDTANAPSIRLLERLGFRREGHFVQSFYDDGSWRDEYQFALLAAEWAQRP